MRVKIWLALSFSLLLPGSAVAANADQALIDAIQKGDAPAISAAIQSGANVNNDGTGVNPGLAPIIVAILSNDPEVVAMLLKAGADPNLVQHDHYPIYDAVNADTRILKLLLDARANPNVTTRLGNYDTPLHRAASCDRQTYIELSKRGGYKGNFPDCELDIRLLFSAGAAIEAPGFHRNNPLMEAVYWNHLGSAKQLLAAGANIETRNALNETPLMTALHNYAEEDYSRRTNRPYIRGHVLPMIGLLLTHGANPNVIYEGRYDDFDDARRSFGYVTGNTPLTLSARYGWPPVARLLLEHSADPEGLRSDGMTPLAITEKQGHKSLVELLRHETHPVH